MYRGVAWYVNAALFKSYTIRGVRPSFHESNAVIWGNCFKGLL